MIDNKNINAAIDIGSNSVLMSLKDKNSSQREEYSQITRLAEGLNQSKQFSATALERTYKTLDEYHKILISKKITTSETLACATEAARIANNSSTFFQEIEKKLGFKINILSTEGEAYYSALGVTSGFSSKNGQPLNVIIIDLGGASTEIIIVENSPFKIVSYVSIPLGALLVTELSPQQLTSSIASLSLSLPPSFLSSLSSLILSGFPVITIGGTATTLANIITGNNESFIADNIQGMRISIDDLMKTQTKLAYSTEKELKQIYPFLGERAKTIIGGNILLSSLLNVLKIKYINISTHGLRHGLLYEGKIKSEYIFS
ncbi:MAG: hypothetical protein HQK53_02830 [Oligoflexia bacterium]|nr:hypothetical protein [Oligoflexia bacterium]